MDIIKDLPTELQNKVFFYFAQHPCATLIREEFDRQFEKWYKLHLIHKRTFNEAPDPESKVYDNFKIHFQNRYFWECNWERPEFRRRWYSNEAE